MIPDKCSLRILGVLITLSATATANAAECSSEFISFDEAVARIHYDAMAVTPREPVTPRSIEIHRHADAPKLHSARPITAKSPGVGADGLRVARGYAQFLESRHPDHAVLHGGGHQHWPRPVIGVVYYEPSAEIFEVVGVKTDSFSHLRTERTRDEKLKRLRETLLTTVFGREDVTPAFRISAPAWNISDPGYQAESLLLKFVLEEGKLYDGRDLVDFGKISARPDYQDALTRMRQYDALLNPLGSEHPPQARLIFDMTSHGYPLAWWDDPEVHELLTQIASDPRPHIDLTLFWDANHVAETLGPDVISHR